MNNIKYYIWSNEPDSIEFGDGGLMRLEDGAPWLMAEFLAPEGGWEATELMARHYLLGSTDAAFTETTPERARSIAIAWLKIGRLSAPPHPMPGESCQPSSRSPEEVAEREQFRANAQAMQDASLQRWAQVKSPPGAESVGVPDTDE
jgi:hypothetical protein